MTAPEQQDIVQLDAERKSRRARLADTLSSAKTKLAPATLTAKVGAEQKKKIGEAGRRAGEYGKDHKMAVGGTLAALAAGVAGYAFYNRRKKKNAANMHIPYGDPTDSASESSSDGSIPYKDPTASAPEGSSDAHIPYHDPTASSNDLDEALAKSKPLDTGSSAAAAGAAV